MNGSLSLSYIVANLPEEDREALCQQFHVEDHELIFTLTNPDRLHQIFQGISSKQRKLLGEFLVTTEVPSTQINRKTRTRGLESFLHNSAMVFTVKDVSMMEIIPLDYYPVLVPMAFSLPEGAFATASLTPRETGSDAWSIIQPLFELLRFAYHQPLPLTKAMKIHKRTLNAILKELPSSVTESLVNIMWHFSQHAGLAEITEENHVVVLPTAETFFSRPVSEMLMYFLQYVTTPSSFVNFSFFALAANLKPNQWLDLNAVIKWLRTLPISIYFDSYAVSMYLKTMADFGVWESHDQAGRLTQPFYDLLRHENPVAMVPMSVIIEPTGDILVPLDALWSDRWLLSTMTTLTKYDQMTVYHVDRSDISDALMHGWTLESYLGHLARMSKTGLPSNIEANIRDWFLKFNRHQILNATIIHSHDASDSEQIARFLKAWSPERLSDRDLIVDAIYLDKIVERLNMIGMPIIPKVHYFDSHETAKAVITEGNWNAAIANAVNKLRNDRSSVQIIHTGPIPPGQN
jgi:hypothetical protein